MRAVQVAIVGAGPAGLSAARALRADGVGSVLVIEREPAAGGIPRHAGHQGFGLRDLKRVLSGPAYARRLSEMAERAGAELLLGTQVTGWGTDRPAPQHLELTGPRGRELVQADAVVLATGCRERPRSARLVAGSRPQGVMTTSTLQQLVYLTGVRPGRRAVIIGAEHVAFSALATLRHAGAEAVAVVTELPRHQSLAAFRAGAALRFRVPLHTRTRVSAILGRRRVEAVELTDLDSGTTRRLECDLVVFTGDWIPDHELAVLAGAELDPGTRGPAVDHGLRTTRPGLFAAGNLLHGAETADVAALGGSHVAAHVACYLAGEPWPAARRLGLRCEPPLRWVAPNLLALPGRPPSRGCFLLRSFEELRDAVIELRQDGRALERQRLPRVMPGRSVGLAPGFTSHADPHGGDVVVRVVSARRRAAARTHRGARGEVSA